MISFGKKFQNIWIFYFFIILMKISFNNIVSFVFSYMLDIFSIKNKYHINQYLVLLLLSFSGRKL